MATFQETHQLLVEKLILKYLLWYILYNKNNLYRNIISKYLWLSTTKPMYQNGQKIVATY